MAGNSSHIYQLWNFAQQLIDEARSLPLTEQEEHGQRIQAKYNQLVSNLSCVGDIMATLYQKGKLTLKELEQIQHLQSTPIRANEELLSILLRKPRDVYECFLSLIKDTHQLHLYQILVSGDDTCGQERRQDVSDHKYLICRNFMWLSEKLDTENGLIPMLYQRNVLTVREKENISCISNTFQKNELLLGLLSKKSPKDFEMFLEALKALDQGHLAIKLRRPKDSPADPAKSQSATSTTKTISHKLIPKDIYKSGEKSAPAGAFSKPKAPCEYEQKLSRRSLSKPRPPPKPGTQPTAAQTHSTSVLVVDRYILSNVNFLRAEEEKFQSRMKELESRLQTDIAVKVTSVSLCCLNEPEGTLKKCFRTLLHECRQLRKDICERNDETSTELEQLRNIASQNSAAATLNAVFRTQLNSVHLELNSERLQRSREQNQSIELMDKLTDDINNVKARCRLYEEEKLMNDAIKMAVEERLMKAEHDNEFFQQQILQLQEELHSEKVLRREVEDKFRDATVQLEQRNCEFKSRDNTSVTKEIGMVDHNSLLEISVDSELPKKFDTLPFIKKGPSGEICGPFFFRGYIGACERITYSPGKVSSFTEDQFCNEGRRWMELDHKNLLRFFDVSFHLPSLYVVMEYAKGRSVRQALDSCSRDLKDSMVKNWATQIANGMDYLHAKDIVHGRLKAAQILIMEPFELTNTSKNLLKIASYKLTIESGQSGLQTFKVMFGWMAPEVLKGKPTGKPSDVWSYGITVWEILTRAIPNQDQGAVELMKKLKEGTIPVSVPSHCPISIREILNGCWEQEVSRRLTFSSILLKLQSEYLSTVVEGT